MHFVFEVRDTGISPYAVFMLSSFLISFGIACILLLKKKVNRSLAVGSAFLNWMLAMLFGNIYATIVFGGGDLKPGGFASMGGLLGIVLGTFLQGILFREYKSELWKAYSTVIPLIYAISKMGCFFVGCCYGIGYSGPFSVTYHGSRPQAADVELFPVQLLETLIFLLIFIVGFYLINIRNCRNGILYVCGMSAIGKFLPDYLRASHRGVVLSSNQIMCMVVLAFVLVLFFYDSLKQSLCRLNRE